MAEKRSGQDVVVPDEPLAAGEVAAVDAVGPAGAWAVVLGVAAVVVEAAAVVAVPLAAGSAGVKPAVDRSGHGIVPAERASLEEERTR